jgi:lysophospholipase L1-like esterase
MIEFIQKIGFMGDSGASPEPPLPDPTTVNFTSAQVSPGFLGSVSTTKNAARIYARGALTLWCGFITGTEAKLTNPSDFGDNAGSMQVAIDGGDFISAPNTGSVYTLFSGLPHAKRFVEVRWVVQMGDAPYIASSGNVLEVTGQPPALQVLNKVQAVQDSTTGLFSAATVANTATYTPPLDAPSGITYGSNIGSIRLRGAFSHLAAMGHRIGVCKNGGAPVFYEKTAEAEGVPRAILIPCDGAAATYNVWDDGNARGGGYHFAAAGDSTLLDIGTRRRMDQYGDSITYGSGPGATSVNTETMPVAAALGFVGSTNGISGLTIAGEKTLLDTVLPLKTVSASDVAILAIGGNSATDGIDATDQADYSACIDKLLAKGYGKILCRGILPIASAQTIIDAANAALKSVMDGKANAKLVWIDPKLWTGYETQDDTHPTAAGYRTLAGYAEPAYRAALGL